MDDEREWRIGELAAATGVSVRSLRHYDRIGLLVPSGRTLAGHRRYTAAEVRRLHQLVALRGFGLSLADTRQLLDSGVDPRRLLRSQALRVADQLATARRLLRHLDGLLAALDDLTGPTTDDLITLIEEMTTMTRPLTPEELAEMSEVRRRYAESLTPDELQAMAERRRQAWEAMSPQEQAEMIAARTAQLPPGAEA
jgi:MerR family transcriptional regulator, thiopeptide resistance regulator